MTEKGKIRYVLVLLMFILFLISLNKIIAALNYYNVKKTDINFDEYKKDNVYYWVDEINCQDDLFDSFFIGGWAFCETNIDNSQKEIWVLLVNEKATYTYKSGINNRFDLPVTYNKMYKIKGVRHGIYDTISTVNVKNGVYKIYIYCKENNGNYGLADTNRSIKKDNSGISEYIWHSSRHDVSETEIGENIKGTIDSVTTTDEGYTQIVGWAFTEGLNPDGQSVYVRLTYEDGDSVTYDTQGTFRPDVSTAYKNQLYDNSGFKALVQTDELQGGNIIAEILVKNRENKNVYLAPICFKYMENFTEREILQDITQSVVAETKIDFESIAADSMVNYWIDKCGAGETLIISGWVFISDEESAETKVYLAVTSADGTTRVYTSKKGSRPDVAKVFERDLYTESGFRSVIPLDAIAEGENTITVITDNGQMLKAPKPYIFNYIVGDDK